MIDDETGSADRVGVPGGDRGARRGRPRARERGRRAGSQRAPGAAVRGRSALAEAACRTTGSSARSSASAIDAQDHVWIVHRVDSLSAAEAAADQNPPTGSCCSKAPPVLEFDPAGNLVGHWGGPAEGYEWPTSNHGIFIDHKRQRVDRRQRRQGRARPEVHAGTASSSCRSGGRASAPAATTWRTSGRVAKIFVDPKTNEAYIADGYQNKRVVVIDADSGKFKRYWGAYGNKPDDTDLGRYDPKAPPAQQFRTPVHCADLSNDGLLYVCDRPNDRIQVFKADGTFVKETFIARNTLGDGSTWDVAFSKDPQQKYLYLADGKNEKVYIIERDTMQILTSFGDGGRQPGQFFAVHSIATDSKGNLYTTETYEGRRLQKFVYKGLGPVTKMDQGTVWPAK